MTSSSEHYRQGPPGYFVGRGQELAELCAALDEVSARGRVFLISGEPGIGKTRLADELARQARTRGFRVAWGRCWEGGGAPAYWPWIQVLRAILSLDDPASNPRDLADRFGTELIRILPELAPVYGPQDRALARDSEATRFRLYDAVARLLKESARCRPMLLILDDLHDADFASLEMLRFVARVQTTAPIVLLGTYREVEVRRSEELHKRIADLTREGSTLPLRGLSDREVATFAESIAGRQLPEQIVSRVCAATSGNPLFVEGIVRLVVADAHSSEPAADGGSFKIPDGVRAAIRLRLNSLTPGTRSILQSAAAIGNDFDAEMCATV